MAVGGGLLWELPGGPSPLCFKTLISRENHYAKR